MLWAQHLEKTMKLGLLWGGLTSVCLMMSGVHAEERTLYLGAYGGSTEKLMMEVILPPWQKANNAKVVYVPGNSTSTLAKLQAQKGNQELDLVFLDDGPMYQAISLGYCAPIEDAAIFNDVYDIAKLNSDKAIGVGFVSTGLAYDKETFSKNGWAPPTSWKDLADPKYKGKVVVPPISNTYGLHALIMMARLNGGGENNIDPGFKAFIEDIGPNVLTYEPSSGKMSELFQNREAVLSVWGDGRLKSLNDTGFPGGFVRPEEGGVALMVASCPVVGSDVPDLAQSLLQYLLTPENQLHIAKVKGWGPTNKKTEVPTEMSAGMGYGPEDVAKLNAVDWNIINPLRAAWTKRWTREVER